jgi:hypothetical protein
MLTTNIINTKSDIIYINQHLSLNEKNNNHNEYSLKHHLFDPFKGSPPNLFMLKLKKRMSIYESSTKDDNFDNK